MKSILKHLALVLALTTLVCLVACGNAKVEDTTAAPETTASPVTTNPPVVVGEIPDAAFVGGDWSGTLTWGAFDGATSYDVYRSYADEHEPIAEGITATTLDVHMLHGATAHFEICANGKWYGEDAVLAKATLDGKANGIRVNDMAPKDDKMRYYVPNFVHRGGGLVWINGEIWLSDGGNVGDQHITNKLMEMRKEYLGDQYETYKDDENAKLGINIYITHYHCDHIRVYDTVLFKNPYIAVETIYRGQPEEDPSRRENSCGVFLEALGKYPLPGMIEDHVLDWAEPLHIDFRFSDATVDFYPQPFDWSKDYYYDNGKPNNTKGHFWIQTQKEGSSILTLAQNCNSMWATFRYKDTSILFTGDSYDVDRSVIKPMIDTYGAEAFDVDVLVYLHHGISRYSALLLDTATPKYVSFTSGIAESIDQNPVKLAYKVRLNMLYFEEHGIDFFWGEMSEFTITLDGQDVSCDAEPVPYDWSKEYLKSK